MRLEVACLLSLATFPATAVVAAEATHDHQHALQAPAPEAVTPDVAMRQMRAMHEKMQAAKTPAERQALMSEHMKAMQQGMMSMQRMDSTSCMDAAGKARMNMMDMMMRMMAEQSAGSPPQPPAPEKK